MLLQIARSHWTINTSTDFNVKLKPRPNCRTLNVYVRRKRDWIALLVPFNLDVLQANALFVSG